MKLQKNFLKEKLETLFQPYSFIYIFQYTSLSVEKWKTLKKEIHKNVKSSFALHVVPKRIANTFFKQNPKTMEFVGSSCFFACHSPKDIKIVYAILEEMKIKDYSFFQIGAYVKHENSFIFYSFLDVSQVLETLSPTTNNNFIPFLQKIKNPSEMLVFLLKSYYEQKTQ